MSHEGHGGALQHHLGGGQVDEVVVGQIGILAISPHVGGEVSVNVGVAEGRIQIKITFPFLISIISIYSKQSRVLWKVHLNRADN